MLEFSPPGESREQNGEMRVTTNLVTGKIHTNLTVGVDTTTVKALEANQDLCSTGLILGSRGFVVNAQEAEKLGAGKTHKRRLFYPFFNGRDLTDQHRGYFVIDTYGFSERDLLQDYPEVYQHLRDTVFLDRANNRDKKLRDLWWLPRRSNEQVRKAIRGLGRYIATPETASHRFFVFLAADVRPEHRLIVTGSDDAYVLGILSSSPHVLWGLRSGGTLEDRPVYNKTFGFDAFPFPDSTEAQMQTIRDIAERLDAHRKRRQQLHPALTLTDMYNVLEKLRANQELTPQDHALYDAGLIGTLRELHDDLDRAVFDAYGWPQNLTTEEILARIVALNAERRAEEASGLVRWLRPDYQAPAAVPIARVLEGFVEEAPAAATRRKQPWPGTLPEQVRAIKEALRGSPARTPQQVASTFRPASRTRVGEILATLVALGQARVVGDRYSL